MPGVTKWRTHDKVNRSIQAKKTTVRTIKERAAKVLEFVKTLSGTNSNVSERFAGTSTPVLILAHHIIS